MEGTVHSLAMAEDILEAVLSKAAKHSAKKIKAISVKVGDEHFIESDSLQFCLEAAAKGTIAEEAQIEVKLMVTSARCPQCGLGFSVEAHSPLCPHCGNRNLEILTGKEIPQIRLELD